jgi:hypothetical protein
MTCLIAPRTLAPTDATHSACTVYYAVQGAVDCIRQWRNFHANCRVCCYAAPGSHTFVAASSCDQELQATT